MSQEGHFDIVDQRDVFGGPFRKFPRLLRPSRTRSVIQSVGSTKDLRRAVVCGRRRGNGDAVGRSRKKDGQEGIFSSFPGNCPRERPTIMHPEEEEIILGFFFFFSRKKEGFSCLLSFRPCADQCPQIVWQNNGWLWPVPLASLLKKRESIWVFQK